MILIKIIILHVFLFKIKAREEYMERCRNKISYPAPNKKVAAPGNATADGEEKLNSKSNETCCEIVVLVIVMVKFLLFAIFWIVLFCVNIYNWLLSLPMFIWYVLGFILFCVLFCGLMFFIAAMFIALYEKISECCNFIGTCCQGCVPFAV